MKSLKGISVILLCSFLFQACVPDSLTKFKEDSIEKEEEVVEEVQPVDLVDEDGNTIEADEVTVPTSVEYTSSTIFTIGSENILVPGGNLGDLLPDSTGVVDDFKINNLNPRYSIVPTLPTGVEINSDTGVITLGSTATVSPNLETSYAVQLIYQDPSTGEDVTLSTASSFTISVQEPIPSDVRYKLPSTGKIVLKVSDNSAFTDSSVTTDISSENGGTGTILFTDTSNNIYVDVTSSGEFKVGDKIDNESTYSGPETTIEEIGFFFETSSSSNIELEPTSDSSSTALTTDNSLSFSITPDLPGRIGSSTKTLDIETDTSSSDYGKIVGYVSDAQDIDEYTVTISNDVSSQEIKFKIAISESPQMLSYTDLVVFQVDDASKFEVGSRISASPVPPAVGAEGVVKYKNSQNYLIVQVQVDGFAKDLAVDNADAYVDEKARIQDTPEPVTSAVTVAAAANFEEYTEESPARGSVVCHSDTSGGAKAIVTKIDTANNILFIAQQKNNSDDTQDGTSPNNYPGEIYTNAGTEVLDNSTGCDSLNVIGTSSSTISNIWSPMTDVYVGGGEAATFNKGGNFTTTSSASGYVLARDTTNDILTVSNFTSNNITDGSTISEQFEAGTGTVSRINTYTKFDLERGVSTYIKPLILKGNNLTYSLDEDSSDLPSGLTLDSTTGVISGTPTETAANATYTIVAENVIGKKVVDFDLQVYDYFKIQDTLRAPSYILHRGGDNNNYYQCRIEKDDILNPASVSIRDITCNLEAGESDLYYLGLKIKAQTGPGICEFIKVKPYSYYAYPPVQTSGLTSTTTPRFGVVASNSCSSYSGALTGTIVNLDSGPTYGTDIDPTATGWTAAGVITDFTQEDDFCQGNYDIDGDGNADILCDAGKYKLLKIAISEGDTAGNCNIESGEFEEIECNGNSRKCLAGPIRDVLTNEQIEDIGLTGLIIESWDSLEREDTFTAPVSMLSGSNVGLANFNTTNSCTAATTYATRGWTLYSTSGVSSATDVTDPFKGGHPFYTYECLDAAYEVKARINVNVRDWDRTFLSSDTALASFLSASPMDDAGTDPDFNNAYNSFNDWDDLLLTGASLASCDDTPTAPVVTNTSLGAGASATINEKTITGLSSTANLTVGMKIILNGTDTYTIKDPSLSGTSVEVYEFIHTTRAGVAAEVINTYQFPYSGISP